METITKICVHHSGGMGSDDTAKSSSLTIGEINRAHQARDFNLSEMGYYVGYNAVIFPDGTMVQTRFIGEQTAAAVGSNFDTVHICLLGNFNQGVEVPTWFQQMKLRSVLEALITGSPGRVDLKIRPGTVLNMSFNAIYPHRVLQPNHTECYGNGLTDTWARDLIKDSPLVRQTLVDKIQALKAIVLKLLRGSS